MSLRFEPPQGWMYQPARENGHVLDMLVECLLGKSDELRTSSDGATLIECTLLDNEV